MLRNRPVRYAWLAVLLGGQLVARMPGVGAGQELPTSVRTVFVSVVDGKGIPIAGLTSADFTVKEDGKTRPVIAADVTKIPMTVALLIDDSGLGLQSIREGAAGFVTRLRGAAQISITTTAGRNLKLLDFSDSTPALVGAINKVFARNQTGSLLVEGLAGAAREFASGETRRPVIVSVGVEGDENSSMRANDALAAIQRSGAQVYLVRLGRPVIGQSNPVEALRGESNADEGIQANSVFGQAPSRSGGKLEQLSAHTGIPRALDQIATELLGQYALTYASADLNARDLRLQVETLRRGARVRAPTRVGPPRN